MLIHLARELTLCNSSVEDKTQVAVLSVDLSKFEAISNAQMPKELD